MSPTRAYWLLAAVVFLALLAAVLIFADDPTKLRQRPLAPEISPPASTTETPRQDDDSATAKVQRMLDSGQFAPPPGDPAKMYSIASPFSSAAAPPTTAPAQEAQAGVQPPQGLLSSWTAPNGRIKDKTAAPAVKTETPPARPPAQPQPQAGEFETPPGIGSAKGGQ